VTKGDRLIRLYNKYIAEFNCREIVTGHGNPDSGILLIGEAPGKDEVRLGRPFVGAAGKQLDEFLSLLGLNKDSMFITNAIKYRLAKRNEETGRISNRPAKADEIILNRSYLMESGDMSVAIGNVHGQMLCKEINGCTYILYPLYHPASIIYNRSLKDVYIKDVEALRGHLSKSSKSEKSIINNE
jgi:uracil-DNA glycosylase family 4